MKFKKKVSRLGNSQGILFDRVIRNTLGIKHGDMVEVDLRKIIGDKK